jgi:hypothetical protein
MKRSLLRRKIYVLFMLSIELPFCWIAPVGMAREPEHLLRLPLSKCNRRLQNRENRKSLR